MVHEALEKTAQERSALVAWHLAHGEALTVAAVIALTGLSYDRSRHLMAELSRVLPIYSEDGFWQVAEIRELG
ncbi:MAG: hypothetical protein MUP86_00215 [Dehalococcoidia bacterium]|nr:hypothetical protein [Dehalococcoidia bacterium]